MLIDTTCVGSVQPGVFLLVGLLSSLWPLPSLVLMKQVFFQLSLNGKNGVVLLGFNASMPFQ